MTEKEKHRLLNSLSQSLHLPNGGFVCAADASGRMIAHPQLKDIQNKHFYNSLFTDYNNQNTNKFIELDRKKQYEGFFYSLNSRRIDIISIVPIKKTNLRILVHQDYDLLKKNVEQMVLPIFWISLLLSSLIGIIAYIISNRMVVRYESRLEEQNHQLKISNDKRLELLHILVHDLKNPLGAVHSSIELLEQNIFDRKECTELIRQSSSQGLEIIDFVREMQALEEGKRSIELSAIPLETALNNSRRMLQPLSEKKDIRIKIDLDKKYAILAEETSLVHSILNNILSNAIKFSKLGGTVQINAYRRNDFIILGIRDFGVGIPPGILKNIFEDNKKTTRTGTAGEIGTGFGMPLVKKFLDYYGASIAIQSWTEEKKDGDSQSGTLIELGFKEAKKSPRILK